MTVKLKLLDQARAKIRLKQSTSTEKRAALAGAEQRGQSGGSGLSGMAGIARRSEQAEVGQTGFPHWSPLE